MSPDIWNDPGLRPRPADHAALSPVSFLTRAARTFPNRPAIVYGNLRKTWREHGRTCPQFALPCAGAGSAAMMVWRC